MRLVRILAILAGLGLLVFVGVGIYRAGLELPVAPSAQPVVIEHGLAQGRRMTGPSWRFDYDTVQTSPDGSLSEITGVRNGILYRKGKPFITLRAAHLSLNTVTNDFSASGPIHLRILDPKHHRTLDTDAAIWTNASQTLTLSHPVTIRDDGAKIVVKNVTIDFAKGTSRAGPIEGSIDLTHIH
jgi:hypothetical protein